jgi:predicted HTH transcriptional regulator
VDALEFATLLQRGYELPSVEFKGPGKLKDDVMFAKVLRAALGLSNNQDGGKVIIGVEEGNAVLIARGLTDEQVATWTFDHVADAIRPHAEPSIQFDFDLLEYQGNKFVILTVHQFDDVPILCRKTLTQKGQVVVREGACLVRSRAKPEVSEVPTYEEMRRLLDLAIDIGVQKFVARAYTAGLTLTMQGQSGASDQQRFDDELGEFR